VQLLQQDTFHTKLVQNSLFLKKAKTEFSLRFRNSLGNIKTEFLMCEELENGLQTSGNG